jgi:hypothetical protein
MEWGASHDLGLDTRSIVTINRLFQRCRDQDVAGHLHIGSCFRFRSHTRVRPWEIKQRPCAPRNAKAETQRDFGREKVIVIVSFGTPRVDDVKIGGEIAKLRHN